LSFDGGTVVLPSASPHVVGKWAVQVAVDPEEMSVAALSDCHMLSFLHVGRLAGFTIAA
jgi:organic hydroperoxide reductase OsmC/OhrA